MNWVPPGSATLDLCDDVSELRPSQAHRYPALMTSLLGPGVLPGPVECPCLAAPELSSSSVPSITPPPHVHGHPRSHPTHHCSRLVPGSPAQASLAWLPRAAFKMPSPTLTSFLCRSSKHKYWLLWHFCCTGFLSSLHSGRTSPPRSSGSCKALGC